MQSLSRGWSFMQQAWQMAFKDKDLIKPSIYALIAGFIVSIIGIIPLIGAAFLFGGSSSLVGQIAMVVVGAILIFVHYVVSYLFSGVTVYLIYGYLSEGDGRMDKAFAKVQREFWNIISLAAVSTVINMFTNRLRNSRSRRSGANLVGGALGGLIETVWTEASYLILPAMMIEDANLATGIKRATQIAKSDWLLIGLSTVGVRWITGFISFVLGAIGLVFGLGMGFGLISLFNSSTIALIIGIGLGAMIFFVFVMVAGLISTYTMTAYNTCLFLWARDVEKAQAQGDPIQVAAPAPLAAALV
jgi:hypothetical protein